MMHDVVIVGAGPAGSTAAAALARRGRDVVLVDRCGFPRDKACGDGVPPGTVELLEEIGLAERIRAAGFYRIDAIRLGSPWGRVWETRFSPKRPAGEFYIAPRVEFDALLVDHALECGAHFERAAVTGLVTDGQRVTGVQTRSNGEERTIEGRVVLGADGATSVVARSLRRPKPDAGRRGIAIRAYVDGIDVIPHTVEFYFLRELLPGYAWVFPLGEGRANVGVIVRADRYHGGGDGLRGLLNRFLDGPALAGRAASRRMSAPSSWQLPLAVDPGGAMVPRAFDGALLLGDAGGFVDALTGEGIHNAVHTAIIAAGVVDEALERGDTSLAGLSEYDRRCERSLGQRLRRSYMFHRRIACAPAVLESLFVVANAGPGVVRRWLNRASNDFVMQSPSNTAGRSR